MRIASIEAIPFRVPMKGTVKFATGQLSALEHVLVRARSESGIVGVAEAPARPMVYGESVASIVHAIRQWFAPALIGVDARATERIWAKLDQIERNPVAKGSVDMALFDLVARALGQPCYKLLGGWSDEVEVLHILGIGLPKDIAAEAVRLIETLGIRSFKLKAGMDPARDTELIRAVRGAVGPDVRLTVDCNHGYDSDTAQRVLPRWEEYDIAWVEEPCPGWDVRGRELVAACSRLPLMVDESATDRHELAEEIRRGVARFLSIKTARTGVYRSTQMLHQCEAAGIHTVVGSQGDTDIGTMMSVHFQAAHRATSGWPGEQSFYLEASDHISTSPLQIRYGRIKLDEAPGTGVVVDEEKLRRYRIDQ